MIAQEPQTVIYTLGHSARSLDELVGLLRCYEIERLVDIRSIPRSWHNPQFNSDQLPESLGRWGIGYVHMKELGGLRHPAQPSTSAGWRNRSFRGFADYMRTDEFQKGLHRLLDMAREHRVAIMCAEAVPWRCHRYLVADALTGAGVKVEHILAADRCRAHSVTSFARLAGGKVAYPDDVD